MLRSLRQDEDDIFGDFAEAVDAAALDPLPILDESNGRVLNAAGVYIGAIRLGKVGTNGEFLSVYCSAHKCTKLYRLRRNPSKVGLLHWLHRASLHATAASHIREMDSFAIDFEVT
jgi:ribosomal protein L24E